MTVIGYVDNIGVTIVVPNDIGVNEGRSSEPYNDVEHVVFDFPRLAAEENLP